jgi:hypothetical protein
MTPSVAAASLNVAPVATAAPFAVVSTAVHDREWWAEEAVRAGTDRSGLAAAVEMMVAAGMVEQPQPETITPWDAPSWREAAAEYHRDRSGRLAVEIEPKRLERLRRFMAHSISLERVYDEIGRNRATPAVTVEALKLAVREHGPKTLAEPEYSKPADDGLDTPGSLTGPRRRAARLPTRARPSGRFPR